MNPEMEWGDAIKNAGIRSSIRGFLLPVGIVLLLAAAVVWWISPPPADPLVRAQRIHGIILPRTASNIQGRGDAWHGFLDRGECTVFEMDRSDLGGFVGQLKVNSRNTPVRTDHADPLVNGWNVWPTSAKSFVPGNGQYGGFKRTWSGDAVPVEMLSCASPKGDWLHVEFWKIPGDSLMVKMYTDWN
jgi:hypothetical protein